jgi:hypothetical protein
MKGESEELDNLETQFKLFRLSRTLILLFWVLGGSSEQLLVEYVKWSWKANVWTGLLVSVTLLSPLTIVAHLEAALVGIQSEQVVSIVCEVVSWRAKVWTWPGIPTGLSNTATFHFKETVVTELQAALVGIQSEQVVSIVCEVVSWRAEVWTWLGIPTGLSNTATFHFKETVVTELQAALVRNLICEQSMWSDFGRGIKSLNRLVIFNQP